MVNLFLTLQLLPQRVYPKKRKLLSPAFFFTHTSQEDRFEKLLKIKLVRFFKLLGSVGTTRREPVRTRLGIP